MTDPNVSYPAELYVRLYERGRRRLRARESETVQVAAAFLDRDGVINNKGHYVNRPADFELLPGVGDAIRRLNEASVPVVVVTNQGGVAMEYLSIEDLDDIQDRMDEDLAALGAHVDAVYGALAYPEGTLRALRKESLYRKPAAGMLYQAADDLGIDLAASTMVGDTSTDIAAGKSAGCRTILVRTGFAGRDGRAEVHPDHVVADLSAAVDLILGPPDSA